MRVSKETEPIMSYVITRGNRRRGLNLRPRDPSLSYTNSVWNCAKELEGGS